MSIDEITPGTRIQVRVVKTPTNASAATTLRRVLGRDLAHRREAERLKRVRAKNLRYQQRGGRQWAVRVPKQEPVEAEPGASANIPGTLQMLRDLKSVERFVEVTPAS